MTATRGRGRPRKEQPTQGHESSTGGVTKVSAGITTTDDLTADDIDADTVRRVERATGRLSSAWGYLDPREIIAASINEVRGRVWKL